jgi:hypothetical protein
MGKERSPRQMHLTEVHPGGYGAYWKLEHVERESVLKDPEEKIARLHDPKERQKLISSDVSREWREQLKMWGYTTAARNERMRENFRTAVEKLKREGVWVMIVEGSTLEELQLARDVLADSKKPIRIPESSENLTIYPDEASWWKDVYGSVPKEVLIKELTG